MMTKVGKLIDILPLPVAPPNLKIGRELNRGAWGTVHEGQLDGESVAVKTVHKLLKDAEHGDNAVISFFDECERLKGLDHPHVIKFRGAFKDAALGPILVMEKMNKTLRDFLEANKGKLKIKEQIRISHEITQGVAFLHQLTPPMVHRDLSDKNVMVTFDGVVKICDFGQSKLRHDSYLTSAQPGMVLYMPPEALDANNSKYDESLDMFSLGVLMLEIGTQQQPMTSFAGIGSTPEIKRRAKDLQKMGDLHPLKPFILLCLSDDQKQRPKAAQMCTVLSRLEENMLQTILAAENRFQRLTVAKGDCRKTTKENQRLPVELNRVKTDIVNREDTIRQLQARCKLLDAQLEAFPSRSEIEHSEAGPAGQENTHSTEQDPDMQDANMKDAPSCEKCGQIFPWNQQRLLCKHLQECARSAESGESVAKSAHSDARSKTLPQSTQPRYTGLSTTDGTGESDTQSDANDEDAPKCEKCGQTFPWNQLHLRWKHTCEPTEVDHQLQRTKSSASRKPLPVANVEQLSASCTVEFGVGNEAGELHVCGCGKTFADNQQKQFMIHKLQCPKGTPICPPGAQGATLRK